MNKTKKYLLAFMLSLIAHLSTAHAAQWFIEGGLHAGGDELVGVTFTSGSTSSIDAGALLSLVVGLNFDLTAQSELRLAMGYKVDDITATNGSVTFDRFTTEAMLFYKATDKWSLGVGLTQHLDPVLEGSGVVAGRVDFKDATGSVFEVDYQFSPRFYMGGKLTYIEYETAVAGAKVSGDSAGILFGYRF